MLFRKKKLSGQPVPIEKIQEMSSMGISDKDIIKRLKKEGYSYETIERAMLEAVKEGVGEGPSKPAGVAHRQAPLEQTAGVFGSAPSGLESSYATETPDEFSQAPPEVPELGMGAMPPELAAESPADIDIPDSDVIVEELVEGVVDEKWHKMTEKLELFEENVDKIKELMKKLEVKVAEEKSEFPIKEIESKLMNQSTKLEDLEARIGGLEKAFRQFLPSLTRNIENLSSIIHEMKGKTDSV